MSVIASKYMIRLYTDRVNLVSDNVLMLLMQDGSLSIVDVMKFSSIKHDILHHPSRVTQDECLEADSILFKIKGL